MIQTGFRSSPVGGICKPNKREDNKMRFFILPFGFAALAFGVIGGAGVGAVYGGPIGMFFGCLLGIIPGGAIFGWALEKTLSD